MRPQIHRAMATFQGVPLTKVVIGAFKPFEVGETLEVYWKGGEMGRYKIAAVDPLTDSITLEPSDRDTSQRAIVQED